MNKVCPKCGSENVVRNGKSGGLQQFECKECARRFNARTGTILEGSKCGDDAWVELVRCMLEDKSLSEATERLRQIDGCDGLDWRTTWSMKLKVMQAAGTFKWPKLGGVVEFGLLYTKETQKGARKLESTLPDGMGERRARPWESTTELGECGPEFDRVAYAVDESGKCACRVVCGGERLVRELEEFVQERAGDVEIACTDANGPYRLAFKRLEIKHYVKPSWIGEGGDPWRRRWLNDNSDEKEYLELQRFGLVDRIENAGEVNVEEFLAFKKERGLSLDRAEAFSAELEKKLVSERTGVSSKYLDRYVSWAEYAWNKQVERGRGRITTRDARIVFEDFKDVPAVLTNRAAGDGRRRLGNEYVHRLFDWTQRMRKASGNPRFQFRGEDGVECGGVAELIDVAPIGVLKRVAQDIGADGVRDMKAAELRREIQPAVEEHPEILLSYLAYGARSRR
ncbi:MAG: IS1 family transposase [Eggerthellaceae bacterium]|nr:IS1 family transposase [Eggerthellaceae bacterium]